MKLLPVGTRVMYSNHWLKQIRAEDYPGLKARRGTIIQSPYIGHTFGKVHPKMVRVQWDDLPAVGTGIDGESNGGCIDAILSEA